MLKRLAQHFGRWWLSGPKYELSRALAGRWWTVPVQDAPELRGTITLAALQQARTLEQVVDAFRGRVYWEPDPVWQVWDRVYPPQLLLARGGDDCDGMAMLHAQAICFALGPQGWQAFTGSYLADPWRLSHHVALARDPAGVWWAVQPQLTRKQYAQLGRSARIVYGPYAAPEHALRDIASCYGAEVLCYDIRDPHWLPVPVPDEPPLPKANLWRP